MEPAHLSGFAVFAGSVVVALGSLATAWLTKKHETRTRRALEDKVGRQKLYAQFIEEASKLYVDALVRNQAEASAMVGIYALLCRMRMVSNADVLEKAEAVIQTILTTYSRPNKTFPELQNLMLNRAFVDPLLNFSEVCRDELRDFPQDRSARRSPLVGRIGPLLDRMRIAIAASSTASTSGISSGEVTNLGSASVAHTAKIGVP
jgi:hypothetical protein